MHSVLQSDLQVSFKQSLDIFIGGILSQSCLEVLELIQKSIQTLAELETRNTDMNQHYQKMTLTKVKITAELPCEAGQTPKAALSSGQSAPKPLTTPTKPP